MADDTTASRFQDVPLSTDPALAWPAFVDEADTQLFSLLYQFEQSQWWRPADLLARQLAQARIIAAYAREFVPAYAQLPSWVRQQTAPDLERWQSLPILTREAVQQAGDAMFATSVPEVQRPLQRVSTSGSTGMPVTLASTTITRLFFRALNVRTHLWHLRDLGGTFCHIRYQRDAGNLDRPRWSDVYPAGSSHGLDVFTDIDQQLRWLHQRQPAVLLTYPSNLDLLLGDAPSFNVLPDSLQQIRTLGEAVSVELRDKCLAATGLELVDQYSSMELGLIATQCPQHRHYHVQAENVFVEILDESGRPCRPGETGQVVVTDLHNLASPLLRYAPGDLAVAGESCDCGRGLPVIREILGRVRGTMVLRDGTRRWPRGYSSLTRVGAIRQLQIEQRTLDSLLIRLVVSRALTKDESATLVERVHGIFGDYFTVELQQVESIPRQANGKFRDFICAVDP